MASDIWLRTTQIAREETSCHHMGYSFRLAARVLLYAPSYRQDNTYHGLCYTSRRSLVGTRNSSFYLTTHSTHFIYGYMASQIVREETRCHHMDCSFRLTARVLLYAPSHRHDNTYHSLCYTYISIKSRSGKQILETAIQVGIM